MGSAAVKLWPLLHKSSLLKPIAGVATLKKINVERCFAWAKCLRVQLSGSDWNMAAEEQ